MDDKELFFQEAAYMKTVYSMNDGWKFRKAAEIHFDMGGDNDFDMFSGYT